MSDRHTYESAEFLPIGDAARLLGVSVDTMRRWADDGRIPVVRTPTGHRRFRIKDIDALLDQRAAS